MQQNATMMSDMERAFNVLVEHMTHSGQVFSHYEAENM